LIYRIEKNRMMSKIKSVKSISFNSSYGPAITLKIDNKSYVMCFCHRRPDRSFFLNGKQFPICSRCTGILAGCIIAIPLSTLSWIISPFIGIILLIPLAFDGMGQALGFWISTNTRRLLTGISGGFAVGILISYIFFI
jgi:uncharacterized membrane protein